MQGNARTGFSHESSVNESVEWYTPPEVFEAMGATFDLDPCSPGKGLSHVPAEKHYTVVDDGLAQPWEGFVFMNPPYGRETPIWMRKLAEHGNGIALVFARTDVRWFQESAEKASAITFISGRVRFYKGDKVSRGGTPGAGSCLMGFGDYAAEVLANADLGFTVTHPDFEGLI